VSLKLANDSVGSGGNIVQSTNPIFYINPTGNIGISTSTPQSKLHVIGGVKMSNLDGSYRPPVADTELVPLKYVNENFASVVGGTGTAFLQGGNSFGSIATLGTKDAYNLDFITSSTTRMTIDSSGKVGIGTTSPSQKLDVSGSIALNGTKLMTLPNQTTLSGSIIYGTGGNNLVNTSESDGRYNTLIGIGAGNSLTTGQKNTANGFQAGYSNTTGSSWTANGMYAGSSNTTGNSWTANGMYAGRNNTTGNYWTANGYEAGFYNTTGNYWTANGAYAGRSNTTGSSWTANGMWAGYSNTTGNNWTANGYFAGYFNTTGNNWTANGSQAGRYLADGSTGAEVFNNSTYIGANTKVSAEGVSNENVFGYNATGAGSNSVVLGDDNITKTLLKGNVGIATTTPQSKLHVIGGVKMSNLDGSYRVPVGDTELVPLKYVNENFAPITEGSGSVFLQGGNSFGSIATLGTKDAYNLDFITSSTTRMTIDSSGNVGIGTVSPLYPLDVRSTNALDWVIGSDTYKLQGRFSQLAFGSLDNGTYDSVIATLFNGANLTFATRTGSVNYERMRINNLGNVGIATTTPAYKLDVNGTGRFTNTVVVGTPTAATHAATKSYVDSVLTNPVITGDLNMGGYDILGVNKLTVNTIDPLYDINNVLYSSYAPSVVGGVKEEYIGKTKINSYNNSIGEYEKVINFSDEKEGTELWLWYKTVDFNEDNVDVFITPSGSMANVYYKVVNDRIILRSDRSVSVSYRLIGSRFDWKSWPTIAEDQSQKAGLIIK
jgi:hypothetical protein